jgi:hypothetical protein
MWVGVLYFKKFELTAECEERERAQNMKIKKNNK